MLGVLCERQALSFEAAEADSRQDAEIAEKAETASLSREPSLRLGERKSLLTESGKADSRKDARQREPGRSSQMRFRAMSSTASAIFAAASMYSASVPP